MSAARERIVAAIEEGLAALADVDTAYDPDGLEDQLALYGLLQDLIQSSKDAQSIVGEAIIRTMPDRFTPLQVPGGGVFKTAGGKERTRYDQPRLIAAAAKAITKEHHVAAVITDDGEQADATATVEAIVNEFAGLAGCNTPSFSSWRKRSAKALGLDLNRYADVEDAPITCRIEGRTRVTESSAD